MKKILVTAIILGSLISANMAEAAGTIDPVCAAKSQQRIDFIKFLKPYVGRNLSLDIIEKISEKAVSLEQSPVYDIVQPNEPYTFTPYKYYLKIVLKRKGGSGVAKIDAIDESGPAPCKYLPPARPILIPPPQR